MGTLNKAAMGRHEQTELIYKIVQDKGVAGITLPELRNQHEAKGLPAMSILMHLLQARRITTTSTGMKMHYVAK